MVNVCIQNFFLDVLTMDPLLQTRSHTLVESIFQFLH